VLRAQTPGTPCSTSALALWTLVPPLLSVLPVIFASSHPIERSRLENARYEALCRQAGVEILARPAGPVRSIAFDWGPEYLAYAVPFYRPRYRLSSGGRILTESTPVDLMYEGYGHQAEFDFMESRKDYGYHGPPDTAVPYYRVQRGDANTHPITTLTADVVAMLGMDVFSKPRSATGYRLTVTDQRSGAVLGVYNYVLDRTNNRACGANAHGYVDPMAFINDAIKR
jgi:hypothetical protein